MTIIVWAVHGSSLQMLHKRDQTNYQTTSVQFSILRCYELYVRKGDKVVANPKRSGECFRPVFACFDEFINNSITGYPISTGRSQYYFEWIEIAISQPLPNMLCYFYNFSGRQNLFYPLKKRDTIYFLTPILIF